LQNGVKSIEDKREIRLGNLKGGIVGPILCGALTKKLMRWI